MIEEIIEFYGKENQCRLAMEECAELIQAINKCLRYPNDKERRENLLEEIADVNIMLDELFIMFGFDTKEYIDMKEAKENRIVERLKQDKEVK